MHELVAKIRALSAQPVLISSSPVDDGSISGDWRSKRCETLDPFTKSLAKLAAEEHVPMVDQYHALLDLWGNNRRKGAEAAAKKPAPAATPAPAPLPPGATPKPAPIPPSLIPLKGDAVHPGDVGQYTMAATILLQLGAPHEVSSATLSKEGRWWRRSGARFPTRAEKRRAELYPARRGLALADPALGEGGGAVAARPPEAFRVRAQGLGAQRRMPTTR